MYVSSYNYGRDRYLHTQQTTQFRSWWTPLMRIQGGWCRITNSPHPGDWLGSGSMGSFNADDWSVISCCDLGCSLTRVTKSYLLALGTTPISSYFTKHWTKFLTHQTGNYLVTCLVSKMSRMQKWQMSLRTTVSYIGTRFPVGMWLPWYPGGVVS